VNVDAYVICAACLAELELVAKLDAAQAAPIDGEAELRLRRLLDSW
jgi:hypothetical protein